MEFLEDMAFIYSRIISVDNKEAAANLKNKKMRYKNSYHFMTKSDYDHRMLHIKVSYHLNCIIS